MINDVLAIIDWSKTKNLSALIEPLIKDSTFLDSQVSQIAIAQPEICLGIIHNSADKSGYWQYGQRQFILHGKTCGELPINESWQDEDFAQLGSQLWDGIYNLLVWCDRTKSLLVTSDYLSTKSLYYWRQGDLLVISSALKAFRLLPFIAKQLNPQVLASTLAISHPLSDETLIAGVKTLPVNGATVFNQSQTDFIPRRNNSDRINTASEAESIAQLDGLMEQSMQTWLKDNPQALIALSGGLDSRILLGYLKRSPRQITAATWGEPESDDFRLGVELAQATETEYLTYILTGDSDIPEADLKFPGWQTESFSVNNVPFYWRGWIDLLQAQHLPVIHGFLGGPLGGGRLPKWGVSETYFGQEVNDQVINELHTWGTKAASNTLTELAKPKFIPYLTTRMADNLVEAFNKIDRPYVYQRLMCLDFYYRQRRYLGNAISKIMGTFLPAILPFYTKDNLDFVLQLPLELILDRRIFRQLLLKQFPALANFQEADQGKLPVYNSTFKKYRDRLLENRYIWYLFPKLKPRNSAIVFSLLLEKHSAIFIDTFEESANILDDYLDLQPIIDKLKSGKVTRKERSEIMRLFNTCTFINRYFNQ